MELKRKQEEEERKKRKDEEKVSQVWTRSLPVCPCFPHFYTFNCNQWFVISCSISS